MASAIMAHEIRRLLRKERAAVEELCAVRGIKVLCPCGASAHACPRLVSCTGWGRSGMDCDESCALCLGQQGAHASLRALARAHAPPHPRSAPQADIDKALQCSCIRDFDAALLVGVRLYVVVGCARVCACVCACGCVRVLLAGHVQVCGHKGMRLSVCAPCWRAARAAHTNITDGSACPTYWAAQVPCYGFSSVDEYYRSCSSGRVLDKVVTPMLALNNDGARPLQQASLCQLVPRRAADATATAPSPPPALLQCKLLRREIER